MEGQESSSLPLREVDTARPFRSVKEAVAVFGSQKSNTNPRHETTPRSNYSISSPNPNNSVSSSPPFLRDKEDEITAFGYLSKLAAELDEMKRELVLLREREAETARKVAALNSQVQKSVSKLAEIEATNGAESCASMELPRKAQSEVWRDWRMREMEERFEYLPSLSQALSIGDMESRFDRRRKLKLQKKKPIVPLIGDIFSRRKTSIDFSSSVYSF